jgi:hypothetical protein
MGYDLHVARTLDWLEAARIPIEREDIARMIGADPELTWSSSDYADVKGESGAVIRIPAICWRGTPCFWCGTGEIICRNPDDEQIVKLIQIADVLKAHVIGDDGERYVMRRSLFGRGKVQTLQP